MPRASASGPRQVKLRVAGLAPARGPATRSRSRLVERDAGVRTRCAGRGVAAAHRAAVRSAGLRPAASHAVSNGVRKDRTCCGGRDVAAAHRAAVRSAGLRPVVFGMGVRGNRWAAHERFASEENFGKIVEGTRRTVDCRQSYARGRARAARVHKLSLGFFCDLASGLLLLGFDLLNQFIGRRPTHLIKLNGLQDSLARSSAGGQLQQ
jgi:hypothetical protein